MALFVSPITITGTVNGSSTSVTVYADSAMRSFRNPLITITAPQTTGNQASGAKETIIVNLLRVDRQIIVSGYIDPADEANIVGIFNVDAAQSGGSNHVGTFTISMNGTDRTVSAKSLDLKWNPRAEGEQDEIRVDFTVIVGRAFGS